MKAYNKLEVQLHTLLTSSEDRGQQSASRLDA